MKLKKNPLKQLRQKSAVKQEAKKIADRWDNDPEYRAVMEQKFIEQTDATAKTAIRMAEEKYKQTIQNSVELIASAFIGYILNGFFGMTHEQIYRMREHSDELYKQILHYRKADVLAEAKKSPYDLVITFENITKRAIRGNKREFNGLGWRDFDTYDIKHEKYAAEFMPNGYFSTDKEVINASFKLTCLEAGNVIFTENEVLTIIALRDVFGWCKEMCQIFSGLYRSLQHATPEDVQGILRYMVDKQGFANNLMTVRYLRNNYICWANALRKPIAWERR